MASRVSLISETPQKLKAVTSAGRTSARSEGWSVGGANTDADANSDANERDPSHFTAGNLTEKTGFEHRPLLQRPPPLPRPHFVGRRGSECRSRADAADIAERAMQVAPGPGIQVRGIQDEETISRGRRPAATERIYEIFMRGEPGKAHSTRLNCEC